MICFLNFFSSASSGQFTSCKTRRDENLSLLALPLTSPKQLVKCEQPHLFVNCPSCFAARYTSPNVVFSSHFLHKEEEVRTVKRLLQEDDSGHEASVTALQLRGCDDGRTAARDRNVSRQCVLPRWVCPRVKGSDLQVC